MGGQKMLNEVVEVERVQLIESRKKTEKEVE